MTDVVQQQVSATTKQADDTDEAPAAAATSKKASTAAAVITAYVVNEINHRWGYDPKDKQRMIDIVGSTPMEGLQATIKNRLTARNGIAAVDDDIQEICIDQITKAGVDRADAELLVAGVGEQICGAVLYYME